MCMPLHCLIVAARVTPYTVFITSKAVVTRKTMLSVLAILALSISAILYINSDLQTVALALDALVHTVVTLLL